MYQLNGRQVEITASHSKYEEDSYVESAYYIDTGEDLTDEECNILTSENYDKLYQDWYERQICAAEYLQGE